MLKIVHQPPTRLQHPVFTLKMLRASALLGTILPVALAYSSEEMLFNDAFLPEGTRDLDLSRYQNGNPILPGKYRADVALNGDLVNRQDIQIAAQADGRNPHVCIDTKMLELIGVEISKLVPPLTPEQQTSGACLNLSELIEGAAALFDPSSQRLDLSIPQASLRRSARGYVSPELWDQGVTAGTLGYNFNANRNTTDVGGNSDSAYLGLNAGLNVGAWRLRHNGSASWQQETGQDYQTLNTYAQRDITTLKSQLTLGESNTNGEIFDTLAFTGVQLGSDDRMEPQSLRGYAPVVRGIANTNARVVIRQNGNLLYETTVAPGAFVIDDLYSTGYGGDLEVTVNEADGSQHSFIVPFASVAQLLRPGTTRFNITAGETRNNYIEEQARVVQGTVQHGLSNSLTAYGGSQSSDDYMAVAAGLAFGSPIGALAIDLTKARTDLQSGAQNGQSLRMSYNKNFLSTGSDFSLAAYRFSSSGFLDFNTAVQLLDAEKNNPDANYLGRAKNRLSLTANQSLGKYGQLAFSGYTQDYWNLPGRDTQFQMGYNQQFGQMSFGVNATRNRMGITDDIQDSLLFTASMPLDFAGGPNYPQVSARIGRDNNGDYNEQASLSGTAGENREYNYGVTAGHDGASNSNNTILNGQYTGSKAMIGGSLSQGSGYRSASLNMSGSVVAHEDGITATPYTGETMAVVGAEGAAGAKVVGYPGLELDGNGYAVVPSLRPYELNEVAIDPVGSSIDVELEETSRQVAPRAGAVVLLKYASRSGQSLLIRAKLADGSPLPFGATVSDPEGNPLGMVGQGGQLYARVKDGTERLLISWGDKPDQHCGLRLKTDKTKALSAGTLCIATRDTVAMLNDRQKMVN